MLEFILHDLEGNRCEMMVLVCFRMLTGVVTRNMRTQPPELILMLTQGAHTYDAEEEEE